MKLAAAGRLVAGNIAVLIGLILVLLFLFSLVGDGYNFAKSLFPKNDKRAELPTYQDHDYARLIFHEQKDSIKNYVPFSEWRQTAQQRATLNIDEEGHRMHTVGLDNLPTANTLGFFGASTVWGTGVDDNGTIPAYFDQSTDEYNVINYSERGYTSMQNLIDLMTLINQQKAPKVVIFYGLLNDVWVHCNASITNRMNSHLEERRIQNALDRTTEANYLYNNLLAPITSFIFKFIGSKKGQEIAACSNDPRRADQVAEMMVKNLEIANTLVTSYGGEFHAFLQPSAYLRNPKVDYLDLPQDSFAFQKREMQTIMPQFLNKMTAASYDWFTDLSATFDNQDFLLIDHVHSSALGNSLIANRIKDRLQSKQ